jgi:hypothetical protein
MEQLRDHVGRSIDPTSRSAGRKAYAAPHLLEYGSVAKLTQCSSGAGGDAMGTALPRRNPGNAPAKMR